MNYSPHAICLLWNWWLIGPMLAANFAIFLSYVYIAAVLLRARRRIQLPLASPILWMFGSFILFCGMGHLFGNFLTIFLGGRWYWFSAAWDVCTAVVSGGTAIFLQRKVPNYLQYVATAEHRLQAAQEALAKLRLELASLEGRIG